MNAQFNPRYDNNFTHKQRKTYHVLPHCRPLGRLFDLQSTTCGDGKRGHMLFVIHQVFPRTRTTARLGSCTHLNVSLWAYNKTKHDFAQALEAHKQRLESCIKQIDHLPDVTFSVSIGSQRSSLHSHH
jgi:hypothetical protein